VETASGLEIDATIAIDGRLADEEETVAYRVVQEALSNVVKHAQATTATCRSRRATASCGSRSRDDGRGFDPAVPVSGFGLQGMGERIELVGGSLAIEPGDPGTRVEVVLPAQARP
jgi:signal transduction histidine kinase